LKTQYDYWKESHDQVMKEMAAMQITYTVSDTIPNEYFKYIIDIGKMLDFHAVRKWMSDTYGYSEDLKNYRPACNNKHWAFSISFRFHKIYLRGDEELSWFKIRHGDPL
jgi:hypothetical protein